MHFLIVVVLIMIAVVLYRNRYPASADQVGRTLGGIFKRLYYLIFVSIFVGSCVSLTYYYLFTDRTDPDWVRIGLVCLVLLPMARLIHITARWVFYGKLN